MDVKIEDGDGLSSDPISPEIRSSPEFQNAFRTLRTGTLENLRSCKAGILRYLAVDQGIPVKGRKHERLMAVLTKYVMLLSYIRLHSVLIFQRTVP